MAQERNISDAEENNNPCSQRYKVIERITQVKEIPITTAFDVCECVCVCVCVCVGVLGGLRAHVFVYVRACVRACVCGSVSVRVMASARVRVRYTWSFAQCSRLGIPALLSASSGTKITTLAMPPVICPVRAPAVFRLRVDLGLGLRF